MEIAVSLGVSPRQPLTGFADQLAELEAAGARRFWVIDSQLAMKDVYVALALAAEKTSTAWLGTGVTNPLTRHPTVSATAIAAVAELAPGRTLLGIGAGDSAVYGVGLKPARVAEVEAALTFFREVLAGREGEWQGRRYRLPAPPAEKVPVYLAVSQPRMCGVAGRLADGAIVMGPSDPGWVELQVGWIEEGIRAAGRERKDVEISLMTTLSPTLDQIRSWASTQARLLADFSALPPGLERFSEEIRRAKHEYDFGEHLSVRAGHQAAVSDDLAQALAVTGPAARCAERLRALRATGADSFIFPLPGGGRLERLRFIREEVLPLT